MNLIAKLTIIIIALISIAIAPVIQNNIQKFLIPHYQHYFFFQDPNFQNNGVTRKWYTYTWNQSNQFTGFSKFSNGTAHVFYNTSDVWAGAVFMQGKHAHKGYIGSWENILGGHTHKEAKKVEYVEFLRHVLPPRNKFFLLAKVKVLQRNYTVFGANEKAYSHVGVDLMFGFDDKNYDDPNRFNQVAIHADILFSRAIWDNITKTLTHENPESHIYFTDFDGDYRISLTRSKIEQLNQWYTFKLDLVEIIETIFRLLPSIQKIRLYGVLVYVDGVSSYTEVQFDYVKTILE